MNIGTLKNLFTINIDPQNTFFLSLRHFENTLTSMWNDNGSKLVNERVGGVKNSRNRVNVVYEWPLFIVSQESLKKPSVQNY